MFTDIEQLKSDFLAYLNFLIFSSPEILVEKIQPLQGTKLRKIKFQSDLERKLSITSEAKNSNVILNKEDLGIYGFSVSDFKRNIEAIKNNDKNSEKLLYQAIEEMIDSNNEKLYKIYVPLAILIYTELYEKFKHAHSKKKDDNEIHNLLLLNCIDAISPENKNSGRLVCNLITFISAYEYRDLNFNEFLNITPFYQDDRTYEYIFNIIKTIQLTSYKETYINLMQSIEELDKLQVKDKSAINNLITKLKDATKDCFKDLIQAAFYEKQEKYIREKEITEKLHKSCFELINDYQNEHMDEFKNQENTFLKILRFIANLFPTSILPYSKKMTLFFNKKENYIKRTSEITSQLDQLATLNFFRRY